MVFVTHWPKTFGKKLQIDLKLDRMLEMMERLGNPHLKIPPVIHVAGTNGKGSTVAYLRSILTSAGYKVHTYTSPHLIHFNERINLAGDQISDSQLFTVMERARIASEIRPLQSDGNTGLTVFEATTIAAFIAFAEVPADFLILEVGMGGRLDATNIVQNTIVSIITPIALDHQEFLGDTEEEIAHEKAGIMRAGIPTVVACQRDDVMRVIEYHSMLLKSPVFRCGYEYNSKIISDKEFEYSTSTHSCDYPRPSLRGPHQVENAAGVIAAVEILCSRYGFEIYEEDIVYGLTQTYWPARIEPITKGRIKNMLPNDSWEIFLDGAHNASGASTLARWASERPEKKLYIIFGTTRGKTLSLYINEIKDVATAICGVCVYHETNAYLGGDIKKAAESIGVKAYEFEYVPDAIRFIVKEYSDQPGVILICGSLYLAGDVMRINEGSL